MEAAYAYILKKKHEGQNMRILLKIRSLFTKKNIMQGGCRYDGGCLVLLFRGAGQRRK